MIPIISHRISIARQLIIDMLLQNMSMSVILDESDITNSRLPLYSRDYIQEKF